jgi:hypothetical protein
MKATICILALLSGALAMAQAPASHTFSNPLGFSYSIPGDWDVLDATAALAAAKQKAVENAKSEDEKKSSSCVQTGLTARHQGSVIVEVLLPFDCYGSALAASDLASFGGGVANGIQNTFTVTNSTTNIYALGTHHVWIERSHATPKTDASRQYTLEIACTLLQKAAVCWMAMAADDSSLAVFEHGAVTLEDFGPVELVPVDALTAKPM